MKKRRTELSNDALRIVINHDHSYNQVKEPHEHGSQAPEILCREPLAKIAEENVIVLNENVFALDHVQEVHECSHDAHMLTLKLKEAERKILEQDCIIKHLRKEYKPMEYESDYFQEDERRYLRQGTMRGSSWSKETIQKALRIRFSCGATGYEALKDLGYPLPAIRTLHQRTEDIHFESGILFEVLEMLRIKVQSMKDCERVCGLTMDEMSLKPAFDYDLKSDSFLGDVTLPNHSGSATKALVFQICGISTRWKQTIAYFYTSGSVDGTQIGPILKDIIVRCHDVGLEIINVTADMGSSNLACFK